MIYYITHTGLPTKKAFGYAIVRMCTSFARETPVILVVPRSRVRQTNGDVFSYYGVPESFSVREVPVLDLSGWVFLGKKIPFFLKRVTFGLSTFILVRPRKEDVVYSRDIWSLFLMHLKGARAVLEIHYLSSLDDFFSWMMHSARKIVVITNHLKTMLIARGYPTERIIVKPSGFDPASFQAIHESKEDLKKRLGLPIRKPLIVYAGNLFPWKGVYTLVDAYASISDRAALVCVGGSDDLLPSFEKYARSKSGAEDIVILGHRPQVEVAAYLMAADILILPNSAKELISRHDTSPLKLFEYMASGVPIVSSDLPSLREILDETLCVFSQPDDVASLASAILWVIGHEKEALSRAARAKEKVAQYSWDERASDIFAFMSEDARRNLHAPKIKDQAFYDAESGKYSDKRYPTISTDYIHAFFKRRLSVVVSLLDGIVPRMNPPSLLEVGCADGIVLRRIHDRFGAAIASYEGIDTASEMVHTAQSRHREAPISFKVRDPRECFSGSFDIIVEVGVLNYADFDQDMDCARRSLSDGGSYICSIAGKGSLDDRLRRTDISFGNFRTYHEYEKKMRESFDIVSIHPVGLRIPLIWHAPTLARIIQPIAEACLRSWTPGLFHEKVYVLKKKAA